MGRLSNINNYVAAQSDALKQKVNQQYDQQQQYNQQQYDQQQHQLQQQQHDQQQQQQSVPQEDDTFKTCQKEETTELGSHEDLVIKISE